MIVSRYICTLKCSDTHEDNVIPACIKPIKSRKEGRFVKSRKMNWTTVIVAISCMGIGLCYDTDKDAKLRYYYSSLDHYTELPLVDADKIFNFPWYNSSRNTVIFCHGFTGHPSGPAVVAVIDSFLEQGDKNVVFLNWEYLAAAIQPSLPNSYLNWAAPNARKLGVKFSDTLHSLSSAGLNLDRTHLVGHSLGAHIFGIAGNNLLAKGIQLPWITGLDPAGIGFEGRPLPMRLHAGSAGYVEVIHSDPSRYGFTRSMGTVDFWPNYRNNGPVRQPGCDNRASPMFSSKDLCNHNRSWQLLVDSVKYPGSILGSYAKNYRTWKNYSKDERNSVVIEFGKYYKKCSPGNYYFVTDEKSPYGLGKNGL